jgi:hypothetical protein
MPRIFLLVGALALAVAGATNGGVPNHRRRDLGAASRGRSIGRAFTRNA